ncbi:MAG: hypothetical protein U9Q71_04880, partial [Pseudomonadota bacterium]|nr:hypothetical protein [Pseudomonadota bacterium]
MNADVHGAEVAVIHAVTDPGTIWTTIDPVVWLTRIGPGPAWAQIVCPRNPEAGVQSGLISLEPWSRNIAMESSSRSDPLAAVSVSVVR